MKNCKKVLFSFLLTFSGSKNASCRICSGKCHWRQHQNDPYKKVIQRKTETQTAQDVKAKWEEALKNQGSQETVIQSMNSKVKVISDQIQNHVNEIRDCIMQLDYLALKTVATDSAAYLQHLIDNELNNQEAGYRERIKELEEEKKVAQTMDTMMFGGNITDDLNVQAIRSNEQRKHGFEAQQATVHPDFVGYDKHHQELGEKYQFVPTLNESLASNVQSDEKEETFLRTKDDLLRTAANISTISDLKVSYEQTQIENLNFKNEKIQDRFNGYSVKKELEQVSKNCIADSKETFKMNNENFQTVMPIVNDRHKGQNSTDDGLWQDARSCDTCSHDASEVMDEDLDDNTAFQLKCQSIFSRIENLYLVERKELEKQFPMSDILKLKHQEVILNAFEQVCKNVPNRNGKPRIDQVIEIFLQSCFPSETAQVLVQALKQNRTTISDILNNLVNSEK